MARLARWFKGVGTFIESVRRPGGCRSCGLCCELFGGTLRANDADLERWRREGRDDLLRLVSPVGRIWIDPDRGRPLDRCPFLTPAEPAGARCAIHDTKPGICRAYPGLALGRQCVRGVIH